MTYLLDPSLELSEARLMQCFAMGYSNLWILQHRKTLQPAQGAVPVVPPIREHGVSVGDGPWVVFSDPERSAARGSSSFSIVIGRHADVAAASQKAEEFVRKHGIAACVAHLVEDRYWH